jgi:O-antigen ligase
VFEIIQTAGKVAFYVAFPVLILRYPKWFLYWLPFAPTCGLWVESLGLGRENAGFQSFVETIVVSLMLLRWLRRPEKTALSRYLLVIPLLAVPSLVHADGYFLFSAFFFVGMLAGPGVYDYFHDQIDELWEGRHFDWAVLVWNVLALAIKFYEGAALGESALSLRGGGIWSSNHYGGIMLLMLPLVRARWVQLLTLGVMCLQFSRGIYLSLFVYGLAWAAFVSWRSVAKVAAGGLVLVPLLWFALPASQRAVIEFMIVDRFAYEDMSFADVDLSAVLDKAAKDERLSIHESALQMARDSGYLGVGLGGFYFATEAMGRDAMYSNAHNLYLTALAEGGVAYTFAVCGLIVFGLWRAWRYKREAVPALGAWAVYGLYSGELYEASRFTTCMDYYYLLILLAWIARSAPASAPEPSEEAGGDSVVPAAARAAP